MIVQNLTDRAVVQCSGSPSLYSIKIGGMLSLLPCVVTKTSYNSAEFLTAFEGSVAVIFKNTYGLPLYQESATLSGMSLMRATVGVIATDEKFWSANWVAYWLATKTFSPIITTERGQPGSPTLILFSLLVLTKVGCSLNLIAISLAYLNKRTCSGLSDGL